MIRELRPAQVDIVEHIISSIFEFGACGVFAGMGIGKSGAVLIALDALDIASVDVYPALICAPLRVAKNTWPQELDDWQAHLPTTRLSPIVGDATQRIAALNCKTDLYSINYENIPWLVKHLGGKWPFKLVVLDESTAVAGLRASVGTSTLGNTFLKGTNSRARTLLSQTWTNRTKVIELTGTPAAKGLEKLWGQLFFLDYGLRLGRTFEAFEGRYFSYKRNGNYTQRFVSPECDKLIHAAVKDICRSFDAKNYYDVKEPLTIPVWVELPPLAMKSYKEMEKKFFTEIKNHVIEAFNAGTKSGKLSQLANGAAYIGDDDGSDNRPFVTVHDEKLDALNSIIEEASGAPIMCVYWFKSDLARLKKRFPQGVRLDAKKATEDAWNRGDIPLLFVHYKSAGHGLNLQYGGNIAAIFGMTWSLELYMQVIERIGPMRQLQSGYDRVVMIYQILARNTVDEDMMERQATHRDTMEILMEACEKRG